MTERPRSIFAGMTDYTGVSIDAILGHLRGWRDSTVSAIEELTRLKSEVEAHHTRLDLPNEIGEYIGFFMDLFSRYLGDLERLLKELPRGVGDAHVQVVRQIYESSSLEDRRCVRFRDEHIDRRLKDESLRYLVDRIYSESRDTLMDFRDFSNLVPRLRTFVGTTTGLGVGTDADRFFATMAIEEALKSVPEDTRPHPKVGAIVVKNGEVLCKAYRGENLKSHAEYIALEDKLADDLVAGATVYTTLEPCTTRIHPKIPCAQRLIDRKVARVVIGMLDPNPDIRGMGDKRLSDAGIEVQLFPRDLRAQVEEMNREFIRAQDLRQKAARPDEATNPPQYWEQRKGLPETEILKKIWSKSRWRICIRPTEFRKARFQNVGQCRDFMMSSCVPVAGRYSYPWFSVDSPEIWDEWMAAEVNHSTNMVTRLERWTLFRSGLFVHHRAFDEIAQLGDRVHVLEILDTVTAAFEFGARMAERGILFPSAVITFELYDVDGRRLTWPKDVFFDNDAVGPNCWCQEENVSVERTLTSDEIKAKRREHALDVAMELYSSFGWPDSPRELLASEQRRRFGSVQADQ